MNNIPKLGRAHHTLVAQQNQNCSSTARGFTISALMTKRMWCYV